MVLFDEIEKAHPQVFNVLLQLLDDGRLTDSHGRTVDFSNTVVILTSNLGLEHLLNNALTPTAFELAKEKVMADVRKFFRPEFINRLDDIVMFKRLGFGELHDIVDLIVADVNGRLAERQIAVTVTNEAKSFILENGYDAEYGARPLKRWVEKHLVTELSRLIISQALTPKSEVLVNINAGKSKLSFQVKRKSE